MMHNPISGRTSGRKGSVTVEALVVIVVIIIAVVIIASVVVPGIMGAGATLGNIGSGLTSSISNSISGLVEGVPFVGGGGDESDASSSKVALFGKPGFGGNSLGVDEDISDLSSENWDGKTSSVKLQDGYRAALFSESGFSGDQITVAGDSSSLHLNDEVSSAEVHGGDACSLELFGTAGELDEPVTVLSGAGSTTSLSLGDKISSLKIHGGDSCSVKVGNCPFFTTDYGCHVRTFNDDVPRLGKIDGPTRCRDSTGIGSGWSDCISSAEVMGGDSCYVAFYQHREYNQNEAGHSITVTGISNNVHPDAAKLNFGSYGDILENPGSQAVSAAAVRSIGVSSNSCQATLYTNQDLKGKHVTITGEATRLGWKGASSSVRVEEYTGGGSTETTDTTETATSGDCADGSCLVPPDEDPSEWLS